MEASWPLISCRHVLFDDSVKIKVMQKGGRHVGGEARMLTLSR